MMQKINELLLQALHEDVGEGDHTSLASIPTGVTGKAKMIAKEAGIVAGVSVAQQIFNLIDDNLICDVFVQDGARIPEGTTILTVSGFVHSILKTERLVLNIMQRMSGIATTTRRYVEKISGTNARVLDTRKTTPNFRWFEKEAVKIGGGHNHRFGLYDMILIKDNHIDYAGGVAEAINSVKNYLEKNNLNLKVEVETRSLTDVETAIKTGGIDRIMLDNFTPALLAEAVKIINKKYETEASGGINYENILEYAQTGVDFISVGALTHSYKSLDISLKAEIKKS